MFAQTLACTVLGSTAVPVFVEASEERGLPGVTIIGMRTGEAAEARERIRCGLAALGLGDGMRRVVVSIAPADLPKSGAALDLPIALAMLAAAGHVPPERVRAIASHGELGLDGGLRPADGVVASAFAATSAGVPEFIVAAASAGRAALAPTRVLAATTLAQVVTHLRGGAQLPVASAASLECSPLDGLDVSDVRAQPGAARALTLAAAGGHNLLLFGAPGCGKTMLAQRLPTILPSLAPAQALEVASIHDAAGLRERELDRRPPFRAPHHTVSQAALVGGGGLRPLVGEVTLAHRGVLFLDELPEFRPSAVDALRQPLEEREVRLRRAGWIARYPCDTQLVAAMNLCRCGRTGATDPGPGCSCSDQSRVAYRQRVSGAILDRFDMRVRMRSGGSILDGAPAPGSAELLERVARAREVQLERWSGAHLNGAATLMRDRRLAVRPEAASRLEALAVRQADGGRTQRSVLRVARTLADLEGSDHVGTDEVLEAYDLCRADLGVQRAD